MAKQRYKVWFIAPKGAVMKERTGAPTDAWMCSFAESFNAGFVVRYYPSRKGWMITDVRLARKAIRRGGAPLGVVARPGTRHACVPDSRRCSDAFDDQNGQRGMSRSGSRRVLYAQDGQVKELRVRKQVGNAGGFSRVKTSVSLEMLTRSVSYFAIRHNGKWCIYRVQAPKEREFDGEDAAAMYLLARNNK